MTIDTQLPQTTATAELQQIKFILRGAAAWRHLVLPSTIPNCDNRVKLYSIIIERSTQNLNYCPLKMVILAIYVLKSRNFA